jgi:hypothetical protein
LKNVFRLKIIIKLLLDHLTDTKYKLNRNEKTRTHTTLN